MMSSQTKVAIVTGSNKGIGYAIVKGLCEKYTGSVYLTSRNEARGQEAVNALKKLGYNPLFHQLDINDQTSVDKFRDHVKNTQGGVDLLINNAAIAFSQDSKEEFSKQAEETVKTNYFGLLRVCDAFFPLLREHGQVVNISSSAGHLSRIPSEDLRKKFKDPQLTVAKLNDLMNEFVKETKDNTHVQNGWGQNSYSISKVGVSALTRVHQRIFDEEIPKRNIAVNSVHPGYVATDMTKHRGVLTVEEGARAPLYLAIGTHDLKGQYVWNDSSVVDWVAPSVPPRNY